MVTVSLETALVETQLVESALVESSLVQTYFHQVIKVFQSFSSCQIDTF